MGNYCYIFDAKTGVNGGANTTIEILNRLFNEFVEDGRLLPPTLYLQLDNTSGDNKNFAVLSYLQVCMLCTSY